MKKTVSSKNISKLKYDSQGLIPAIIQDYKTKEVLMVAYMNKLSLKKTLKLKKTCFWSRSRKKFWVKGETSGHFQFIKKIFFDCDADCLLIKVRQVGVACHTGKRSCFYRAL
ncbi:phosphoribosyl-AMP cyclohydrolase [Candidatus Omnitrophota bacterium]